MTLSTDLIERARNVPIESMFDACAFGLRRQGRELVGPCPACGGRDRFQVHTVKNTWLCRQCPAGGGVIDLVMHLHSVAFRDAISILTGARPAHELRKPAQGPVPARKEEKSHAERLAYADRIWRAAVPIAGTPGEAYLRNRGIDLGDVPDHGALRFHVACPYGPQDPDRPDGPRRILPCVLARYTDVVTGAPWGVHRRAITAGPWDKTMSLGPVPVGAAVVRLWPDDDVTTSVVLGEGIETVLAAATRIEHHGTLLRPAWACGTAGNLEAFPVLPGIETLTILADHDASGRGQEAAARCAERWADAGREVTILMPRDLGDMNDLIGRVGA